MQDQRPAILIEQSYADWRGPRGYVENVAHAIALASTAAAPAMHRVCNIAEEQAFSELRWVQEVARSYGWKGRFVTLPAARMPAHLQPPGNTQQHWVASSDRIRRELGYGEIFTFEEGLRRTIDWEIKNPPQRFDPKQFDYAAEDWAITAAL